MAPATMYPVAVALLVAVCCEKSTAPFEGIPQTELLDWLFI